MEGEKDKLADCLERANRLLQPPLLVNPGMFLQILGVAK